MVAGARRMRERVFARMARGREEPVWRAASLKDIRRCLVICSAPRSGSSLLFALLREAPGIYAPAGETVPFYKLNGIAGEGSASDAFTASVGPAVREALSRDLLSDFAVACHPGRIRASRQMREDYIDSLCLRLPLQWPGAGFAYPEVARIARAALARYLGGNCAFDTAEYWLEMLAALRRSYPTVNPYYYDIPGGRVAARFPGLAVPCAPPGDLVLEEPPFILLPPRERVVRSDLADGLLLLKSSADAFRLRFLETLLPEADIRVVHLARNPAASINGLYEGWLYRGFFSRDLGRSSRALSIRGYSDRFPWGDRWWKYDLPPGWERYRRRSLEEVCAFQWLSSHSAIVEYLGQSGRPYCRVNYEDIAGNADSRARVLAKILTFAGVRLREKWQPPRLPPVQATARPAPGRWKAREDVIMPLLMRPKIRLMAAKLGYDNEGRASWT